MLKTPSLVWTLGKSVFSSFPNTITPALSSFSTWRGDNLGSCLLTNPPNLSRGFILGTFGLGLWVEALTGEDVLLGDAERERDWPLADCGAVNHKPSQYTNTVIQLVSKYPLQRLCVICPKFYSRWLLLMCEFIFSWMTSTTVAEADRKCLCNPLQVLGSLAMASLGGQNCN